MVPVAIGIGSNLGDLQANFDAALHLFSRVVLEPIESSRRLTEPMYVVDQPPFLNSVARGVTDLGPIELVRRLKEIESELGRTGGLRYGPRIMDLDLLIYGCIHLRSQGGAIEIEVPHSRMFERAFVIEPLDEIWPDWKLLFDRSFEPKTGIV